MKKVLIAGLILFLFSGFSFAQEEGKPQVKEEKKIVIKIIDDEGNVTTKILEGDEANEATENIWISENGDSITVEVELEDGDDIKTIRKKIILSDLEGMDFRFRISTKIEMILRAVDFSLPANYPKGRGDMFKYWLQKHHPGALLVPVQRTSGSRQDLACEGAAAVYWNRK